MTLLLEDSQLLQRFRSGDSDALARVYRHYVDDVALVARRGFVVKSRGIVVRGADEQGQLEIVQDTFVRAFAERARRGYDGLRPYRAYLLTITRNLMVDRVRSRGARDDHRAICGQGVGDIDALIAQNSPFVEVEEPPETRLHWTALAKETETFVAIQSEEIRQFIRLRFEGDLSQEAAAKQMGVTRARARTLERRVLRGLRRHLKRRRMI